MQRAARAVACTTPLCRARPTILVDLPYAREGDPAVSLGVASILAHFVRCAEREEGGCTTATPPPTPVLGSFNVAGTSAAHGGVDAVAHKVVEFVEDAVAAAGRTSPLRPLVCFGAFVWNEPHVQASLERLRRSRARSHFDVVAGGPQVSYAPRGTLEGHYRGVEYFVRGFAESAVWRLASSSSPAAAAAAAATGHAGVEPPSPETLKCLGIHVAGTPDHGRQAQANLEELASPLLDRRTRPGVVGAAAGGRRMVRWETQRGCPFNCTFCQHRAAGAFGLQAFSRERLVDEARMLRGLDAAAPAAPLTVNVLDPTFNARGVGTTAANDILALFGGSSPSFRGQLKLQTRPERLRAEFLEAVAATGVRVHLELGVQSIIPGELEAIERIKGVRDFGKVVAKLEQKFALLRDAMASNPLLSCEVSLIFGLPGQTPKSLETSILWCQRHLPNVKVLAFPLMLLRGTGLDTEQARRKYGLVEDTALNHVLEQKQRVQEFIPHVVESNSFTRNDWQAMARIAGSL